MGPGLARMILMLAAAAAVLACAFVPAPARVPDPSPAQEASPLLLSGSKGRHGFAGHLRVLEDPDGRLTLADVLTLEKSGRGFVPTPSGAPSYGFTDSVYWFSFEVINKSPSGQWLLEVAYPLLDDLTLYAATPDGGFGVIHAGDELAFGQRPVKDRNFVFPVDLGRNSEPRLFYLRVATDSSTIVPLAIWERDAFMAHDHDEQILLGCYYGIVAIMVFYNLFIFFSLHDRTYFYYVLYIGVYMLFQGGLNGLTYEYLWPQAPTWNQISIPFSIFAAIFGSMLFSGAFLAVPAQFPRLNRVYLAMMAVSGAGMAAAFLYPYDVMIRMATLMAIPGIGVMMASGVMSWRKGFTPARFYLTAWTVFLAGQFIYAVHKSWGLFSGNFLALYGGQIGSGLEVVLLSLALADRINVIQAERHVARERAIKALEKTDELNEKLREYSRSLEQRVKDRTRELSLANEKLKALDAMKSDFLANVSHELRTPLTSVLGFATMIQEKLHDLIFPNVRRGDPRVDRAVAKVGRNVGIIVSESERLTDLINNVLDLSKMEAGRMDWDFEPVPLDPLVRRAAETFEYQADQTGVRLSVECEPGLPLVMADTDRLFQVLVNLLSNALKFTSQGSVGVRVRRTNRSVTVSVFDSGVGIRDEDKELVFDKFRQVGDTLVDKPKGTGLGLPICKQIVEHHGGRIWVEDAPNGGSVFSFNLPDTDANAGTDGGADIGTDGEEVRSGRAANRH